MAEEASGLRIRVTPVLRGLIEAASTLNGRTMNAEIAARLQWSFDHGYDPDSERNRATASALEAMQASPLIRLDKKITKCEADLEEQIDTLRDSISVADDANNKQFAELKERISKIEASMIKNKI